MPTSPAPRVTDAGAAQTTEFMNALLGFAPEGMHATLWTRQDKRTLWVPMVDDTGPGRAALAARKAADAGKDVYIGVSLARSPGPTDTRISNATSAGIFGMWADIDVATPDVHKKWNLPPTDEAAHELLTSVGLTPSLLVHSGHGLQAWWLFPEFWEFTGEDERLAAAGLAQRWNATLSARAAERSWVVDSTFDLARVMRVPGTLNYKGQASGGAVVPARLLSHDPTLRYSPDDFSAHCVDASFLAARGIGPTRTYVVGDLRLDDTLTPDFDRFEILRDNSDLFGPTWDKKRKDLNDDASAYDLSLASQAARAGWSDQDIAALIYAFRRRHKLDTAKALRHDYIARTIGRARESLTRADASEAIEEVGDALTQAKASGDDEQVRPARRAALDVIGAQLGLEVLHIVKYLSEPAAFALVTPTATIALGDRDGILRWDKFRGSIWEAVGHQIPRFPTAAWDRLTELIPRSWEEQDVGDEATERGEVAAWLGSYLASRPPVDTLEEAAQSEYPFLDPAVKGRVLLFGPAFKRWLFLSDQTRITAKEMGRRLRAFGCVPDKVNVTGPDGARTTRAVWRLPDGYGAAPPPVLSVVGDAAVVAS